jgi:hypothetical protein
MTDAAFRAWIQTRPSCLTGDFSEYLEDGRRLCVAAHIRRAGYSGTAHKAPFSCVPLRQDQHLYQHQYGELACLAKFAKDPQLRRALTEAEEPERFAKEWFDAQKARYYARWLEETAEGRAWAKMRSVEEIA